MKIFGFVYLWRDKRRKKFCVGSHYGQLEDGYITSTGYMAKAYKKRPEDFRRRILYLLVEEDKKLLLQKEQYFLDMIQNHELGLKYYNLKKHASGGNGKTSHNRVKPQWNVGLTKEMQELRRLGMLSSILDKPKEYPFSKWTKERKLAASERLKKAWADPHSNYKKENLYDLGKEKQSKQKNLSRVRPISEFRRNFIGPKPKKMAWNKGLHNPLAAENGKKGINKLKVISTGRRRYILADGSWTYKYYDNNIQKWYVLQCGKIRKYIEDSVLP